MSGQTRHKADATFGVAREPQVTTIFRSDTTYPSSLRNCLGDSAPERIFAVGDLNILRQKMLALFCSVKCPGNAILKMYDLARALRDSAIPVIGGFHTPMEKECLDLLLRGTQPIVICHARGVEHMRLPQTIKVGIQAGRILLISPFGARYRRVTAELADERNRLVVALASQVFVSFAAPGGKTERLCREIIANDKPLCTVDCSENANLVSVGARPASVEELINRWQQAPWDGVSLE